MFPRACLFLLSLLLTATTAAAAVRELLPSEVLPHALAVIFSGQEQLHYEITWSGGIKIGEVRMAVVSVPSRPGDFRIVASVRSSGPLESFYPVNDTFQCLVSGDMKLPLGYAVLQVEGHGNRRTLRESLYNQKARVVRYRKNGGPETLHSMSGTAYNEIAAFLITRALNFSADSAHKPLVVPAFVDGRRHEVRVRLMRQEPRRSIFGTIPTLKVQPIMQFKGLYDKSGSTVLWISDDRCRVPVEIKSRIAIGALVARLSEYRNPACPELSVQKGGRPEEGD